MSGPASGQPILSRLLANWILHTERFFAGVDTSGDCHLWRRSGSRGYGSVRIGGTLFKAHRVAWVIAHRRDIPTGHTVCHACDNPRCVNPAHLWVGTQRQNMRDMFAKGRHPGPPRKAA